MGFVTYVILKIICTIKILWYAFYIPMRENLGVFLFESYQHQNLFNKTDFIWFRMKTIGYHILCTCCFVSSSMSWLIKTIFTSCWEGHVPKTKIKIGLIDDCLGSGYS